MSVKAFRIVFFVSIFYFISAFDTLNCYAVGGFIGLFYLLFWVEIYSYKFVFKRVFNRAILQKDGLFYRVLKGKISSFFKSALLALLLCVSFVLNLIILNRAEVVIIATISPVVFWLVKFVVVGKLSKEIRFSQCSLKPLIIAISTFLFCVIYAFVFVKFEALNLGIVEFLNQSKITLSLQCAFLNEAYAYIFYLQKIIFWIQNHFLGEYKFILFVLLIINQFLFFTAIFHLNSLFFSARVFAREGSYFLKTILFLAYIMLAFIAASFSFDKESKTHTSNVEKTVKLIVGGQIFDTNETLAKELIEYKFASKNLHLQNTKDELNSYIDKVYESGAKEFARQLADFKYSVMFDYLVLWHGVFDSNKTSFLNSKIDEFIKESFPQDFSQNMLFMIENGASKFQNDLGNRVNFTLKMDGNLSLPKLDNTRLKLSSGFAGTTLGLVTLKTLGKALPKTSAKAASVAGTSSSGVICGPAAIICVPAIGIATWVGFDFLFAKGDAVLNRDEFEKSVINQMMSEKNSLKDELNLALDELFNEVGDEILRI